MTGDPPMRRSAQGVAVARAVRLDPVWRLTARHLHDAHHATAPVTLFAEADAAALVALRQELSERDGADRITLAHLLAALTARVLARHPAINATLEGEELLELAEVNLGLAVALPDDNLVVPVIHAADRLALPDLARRADELRRRALARRLGPEDVRRATFTLSNGGMIASVRWSTPIVTPPQLAILGTGAVAEAAVARGGQVVVRPMLPLSLSFDHRAVNGMPASRFLDDLVNAIASPEPAALGL